MAVQKFHEKQDRKPPKLKVKVKIKAEGPQAAHLISQLPIKQKG